MPVVVISPPDPVIELEDALAHLRVDSDEDDGLIEGFVAAATAHFDGPAGGWLGRAIGVQTLELQLHDFVCSGSWGDRIKLPFPPIVSAVSVIYVDPAGVERTLSADAYRLVDGRYLAPAYGQRWPSVRCDHGAVKIQYEAGYEDVPPPIKTAILMTVAHLYANREAVITGNQAIVAPMGVEALLAPLRVWS